MSDRPHLRVIAYDIADNRRRRKIAETLEDQCVRVQESLFEARLTAAKAARLMADLRKLAGPGDSLRLYTVPDSALPACTAEGGVAIADAARYWLL